MDVLRYYLEDHPRTLFPLSSSAVLAEHCGPAILKYVSEQVLNKQQNEHSFLPQTRVFASKHGLNLRRTVKLDPVAEYFLYDLIFRNRKQFRRDHRINRRSFGYGFADGKPLAPSAGYGDFRTAISEARRKYYYLARFDVATYFNSIYHHDLVAWASNSCWPTDDVEAFGQFLREINVGRSIDCLPHGLHPTKLIGSDFLKFVDNSIQLQSDLIVRFMDDFFVFSNDLSHLQADYITVQELIGERGLSLNAAKTEIGEIKDHDISDIKVSLLRLRRKKVLVSGDVETTEELAPLTDPQIDYLLELLGNPDIEEADTELVLTMLRERTEAVLTRLPDFLVRFPGLSKNIYNFCRAVDDKSEVGNLLLKFLKGGTRATEYQLFWIGKLVEDALQSVTAYPNLLTSLLDHPCATPVTKAKVLEIPDQRYGMDDIRESYLKGGCSNWPTWGAAVGLRSKPPISRNHLLGYYAKISPIAKLIADCVASLPNAP